MGSDSRTTYPNRAIRDTANKIRFVEMQDLNFAMVAHSGDDDLGTRIADKIETLAKTTALTDWQTVSDLGDKAIQEEIKKLRSPYEGPEFKMEEFKRILEGFDSTFMVAHFFNEKPYIFSADFHPGRFSRRNQSSFSIGCGSPIANFILDEFNFSKLSIAAASPILVYVIEEVKRFDPSCGGPTKICWSQINKLIKVTHEDRPEIPARTLINHGWLHQDEIRHYTSELAELRETIRDGWAKKLNEIVSKGLEKEIKRRTAPERFIRMRYGAPLDMTAGEYAKKTGNKELRNLVAEFRRGQANEMPKSEMEILWAKICNMIPSKPELVTMGTEYFKRF